MHTIAAFELEFTQGIVDALVIGNKTRAGVAYPTGGSTDLLAAWGHDKKSDAWRLFVATGMQGGGDDDQDLGGFSPPRTSHHACRTQLLLLPALFHTLRRWLSVDDVAN